MTYRMFGTTRVVTGGGYGHRPDDMFGVSLAPEVGGTADVVVPTVDFGVPQVGEVDRAVMAVVRAWAEDRPVYVGCGAGFGRTGLFLGCLTAVADGPEWPESVGGAVGMVRTRYHGGAVETREQERFVAGYTRSRRAGGGLRGRARRAYLWWRLLHRARSLVGRLVGS